MCSAGRSPSLFLPHSRPSEIAELFVNFRLGSIVKIEPAQG